MTIHIDIEYVTRIEDENKLLNDKLNNLTTMFNEVHDNELETREKKNEILKWSYSLEKEKRYWLDNFKRLCDDNIKLTEENEQLQDENEKLKQELFNLYLKHYN